MKKVKPKSIDELCEHANNHKDIIDIKLPNGKIEKITSTLPYPVIKAKTISGQAEAKKGWLYNKDKDHYIQLFVRNSGSKKIGYNYVMYVINEKYTKKETLHNMVEGDIGVMYECLSSMDRPGAIEQTRKDLTKKYGDVLVSLDEITIKCKK